MRHLLARIAPEVSRSQVLYLEPDDTLVVTVPTTLSAIRETTT